MKKRFVYIGIASLLILASCSNEETQLSSTNTVKVTDSNVQIQLSSATLPSRASVETTANGLFNAEGLGIFCLAQNHLNINTQNLPISWTRNDNEDTWSIWIDNAKANTVINDTQTAINIQWADPQASYWYPDGNWHSYQFYGYYPYQENVSLQDEVFTTDIALDGTQDVIWGRTLSEVQYAYSARYFQGTKKEQPSLAFSHRFMRITFTLVAGVNSSGSSTTAKKLGVKSLELTNMPSTATLTIADRNTPANEGIITCDWEQNLVNYILKDANDTDLATLNATDRKGYWAEDDEQTLGQGFLVPVPQAGHSLQIHALLQNTNGELFDRYGTLTTKPGQTFQAGKSYNVKITIKGPEDVEIEGPSGGDLDDPGFGS